jgi:HicB family
MNVTPYADRLRQELAIAAEAGGEDARALAERLTAPLDSAVRLMLLEALSDAAAEITSELAPGSVEVRLRGGDPEFVVVPAPEEPRAPAAAEPEEAATARINLRLPEQLKADVEQAAGHERLSVNSWLVRAVAAAVTDEETDRTPRPRGRRGQNYKGWVS